MATIPLLQTGLSSIVARSRRPLRHVGQELAETGARKAGTLGSELLLRAKILAWASECNGLRAVFGELATEIENAARNGTTDELRSTLIKAFVDSQGYKKDAAPEMMSLFKQLFTLGNDQRALFRLRPYTASLHALAEGSARPEGFGFVDAVKGTVKDYRAALDMKA